MIVTKKEMIELENKTGSTENQLIEKAGFRCAKEIAKRTYKDNKILILCGKGNNGQDGLEIALHLSKWQYNVHVALIYPEKTNLHRLNDKTDLIVEDYLNHLNSYDLIVDCIFGFSFHLPLSTELSLLFDQINQASARVYSIDINSGMEADTGRISFSTIHSDITFALGALKPCHLLRIQPPYNLHFFYWNHCC